MLKQDLLDIFEYRDGNLYWKKPTGNRVKKGSKVGSIGSNGYLAVKINGKSYLVHRLIYLYHNGYLPTIVDHKDNNQLNNDIDNLRGATHAENRQNAKLRKDNKSGTKGISWDKTHKHWKVQINKDSKAICIGNFEDLELAELVAVMAREKYHGKFARY
jgi:hypothetical protein